MEDWQRPLPTMVRMDLEGTTPCSLGEYLEHPGGTLEALPADHHSPERVLYPAETLEGPHPTARVVVLGGPYHAVLMNSPQPAPRFTRIDRYGRQRRTEAPPWTAR